VLNDNFGSPTHTTQQGSEVASGLLVRNVNHLLCRRTDCSLLSGGAWPPSIRTSFAIDILRIL
jgi:hypothetical protein